jgi:glycosyltransferase involved in cell wall biosynthesis
MDYSVVIPTLGRRLTLQKCIESVERQTRSAAEIILAVPDGVHVDPGPAIVARAGVPSSSGQRNAGFRIARAPVTVFVDDDIELEPDFAEKLMAVWERRGLETISGVVGTCVNFGSFRPGSITSRILLAAGGLGHEALLSSRSRRMLSGSVAIVSRPKGEVEVDFAPSQCVSYRRDLLELEPFDETFQGYVFGEDMDLAARMTRRAPIVHTPHARCWHAPATGGLGADADALYRKIRFAGFYRGRYRARGFIGRIAWEWSNIADFAIVVARALRSRNPQLPKVYARALQETRAHLRAETGLRKSDR